MLMSESGGKGVAVVTRGTKAFAIDRYNARENHAVLRLADSVA